MISRVVRFHEVDVVKCGLHCEMMLWLFTACSRLRCVSEFADCFCGATIDGKITCAFWWIKL